MLPYSHYFLLILTPTGCYYVRAISDELPYKMANNNNVNQTELIWSGKFTEEVKLPAKRLVEKITLPFQTIEVINEPREGMAKLSLFGDQKREDWKNKLIWGDNKLVLASLLKDFAGKINLIYIDPPFDVGADFSLEVKIGDEEVTKEPSILEQKAYNDTWGKGTDSYLQMMYERLFMMRDLLTEDGSIYIHIDWHIGHYLKILLDEVFGRENFRNEIIWYYPDYLQGNVTKGFPRKNDFILFYSKTSEFKFHRVKEKLDKVVKRNKVFWNKETQRMDIVRDEQGKIIYQDYNDKYCDTVWQIGQTSVTRPQSEEFTGYDTQKPLELLRRVIESVTDEGDIVADFFCGSGSMGVAAEMLGRRWVMCDLGRFGIHLSRKRLMEIQRKLKDAGKPYSPFEILNLGKYERQYWQAKTIVGNQTNKEALYIKFIIQLYKGELLNGFTNLHGKKEGRVIHVGAVDAPVTIAEILDVVEECKSNKLNALDILGWEWEMSVNEEAVNNAKAQGVHLRLLQIPKEVMEKQAVEKGEIRFFELNHMAVEVERQASKVKVSLTGFAIPSEDLIPDELREKITNWADYVDYWSVDWDYESLKEGRDDVFENNWQSFRTKQTPKLELETPYHQYPKAGKYTIAVKAIDIFGNDTSKVVEVTVK